MSADPSDRLTPPDRERCQAMKRDGSFMTLGPRSWVRCKAKPVVIVTEREPGQDGLRGSMSLCAGCLAIFNAAPPAICDVENLKPST